MVAIAQLNTHVACPIRGVSFEAQIVGEDVSAHETPTIGDTMATPQARGVIYVHSAPRALCPHLEWAAGRALGRAVNFEWIDQPVLPGSRRTDF